MNPEVSDQVTASASGTATLTLPRPASGTAWTGSLSVPGSNPSAHWQVFRETTLLGAFDGTSTYGQVAAERSQTIRVVGTGVTPGLVVQAVWNVIFIPIGSSSSITPAGAITATATYRPSTLLDVVTIPSPGGGTVTKTYTLDPNCRALSLMFRQLGLNGGAQYSVTGGTTGYQYITNQTPSVDSQRPALNLVQINGVIDQTVIVSLTAGPINHGLRVYIAEEFDPLLIAVESIADAANLIIEAVQKTPFDQLITCTHAAATQVATAGLYSRGFEIQVPFSAPGSSTSPACLMCLSTTATATLGEELLPGGYFARSDYNGSVSIWNLSATTDFNMHVRTWS